MDPAAAVAVDLRTDPNHHTCTAICMSSSSPPTPGFSSSLVAADELLCGAAILLYAAARQRADAMSQRECSPSQSTDYLALAEKTLGCLDVNLDRLETKRALARAMEERSSGGTSRESVIAVDELRECSLCLWSVLEWLRTSDTELATRSQAVLGQLLGRLSPK
jgi:hypothetical protein